MNQGHIPSLSACIIKNSSVVWQDGYGYSDIGKRIQATENTIYLGASITKTITATAIMQLWEQDLFDLDDDVNLYLPFSLRNPYFPNINITFRMLLAHHSSLANGELSGMIIWSFIFGLSEKWYGEYLIPSGLFYKPLYWLNIPPGEKLVYSNIGYIILGYLVELLSGESYIEYCNENIFKPLKMEKTNFIVSNYDKDELARPYIWLNNLYLPLPHYENKNYAVGGMRTSVLDLSRFLIAYMNNGSYDGQRILNNETLQLIKTKQFVHDNNSRFSYGLGWRIYQRNNSYTVGHPGAMPGTLTYMYYQPLTKTGIIIFSNQYSITQENDFMPWYKILMLFYYKADQL